MWTAHHWQHWLDHGEFPDHPWRTYLQRSALTLKGLPTRRPARSSPPRRPRCPRRRAASATGTTATRGSATRRSCSGASTRSASTGRRTTSSTSWPTSPRREPDDLQIMYGIGGERELPEQHARPPLGLRGRAAGADRQRRLRPVASTTSGARSSTRSTSTRSRATSCPTACGRSSSSRSSARSSTGASPTAASGRCAASREHFTSSKLMCWVAADRGARLAEIREELEYAARWQSAAEEIKADICENALDERGVFCQHYDTHGARRLRAADAARALPPRRRRAHPGHGAGDRRRAHGRRPRAALPRRETDDGLEGEEGTFTICSFWLVSALVEIGELARAREPLREAALLCEPAAALRRGDRPAHRTPPRATSRRRSPTSR